MNYLLVIKTLVEAAKVVEVLMPESSGKDKFEAAIAMVEAVTGSVQGIISGLHAVTTLVVAGLRTTGVFKT